MENPCRAAADHPRYSVVGLCSSTASRPRKRISKVQIFYPVAISRADAQIVLGVEFAVAVAVVLGAHSQNLPRNAGSKTRTGAPDGSSSCLKTRPKHKKDKKQKT